MKFIDAHFTGCTESKDMDEKLDKMLLGLDGIADHFMLIYYDIYHQYVKPRRRTDGGPSMDSVTIDIIFASDREDNVKQAAGCAKVLLEKAFKSKFESIFYGTDYKNITMDARQYLRTKYYI